MKRRQPGFTLIELLVVMSIISLLIAILLPTLQSARRTAIKLKSLTQLRQISMALHSYADDYRSYLPFSRARSADDVASGVYAASPDGAYWSSKLYYKEYLKSKVIYFSPAHDRCPNFTNFNALFTSSEWFEWSLIDYSVNFNGAMPDEVTAASRSYRLDAANPPPSKHLLTYEAVSGKKWKFIPAVTTPYSFQGAVNRMYMDGHGNGDNGKNIDWDGTDGFNGFWIPNPKSPYTDQTAAPWYKLGFPQYW